MNYLSDMVSELALYDPILGHFNDCYEPFQEVRTHGEESTYRKSIDILFKDKENGVLIAVEVKMSDWKRAMRQAALNTSYCHYSYVAIPYHLAEKIDRDTFRQLGIGLIGVKEDICEIFIESDIHEPMRMWKDGVLCPI